MDGRTILYLIRHGATEANLASPPRLQGRRHDPPLAQLGVRQAEATRDFLAVRPIDHCYCSPLLRAVQTAALVAAPHGVAPQPLEALTECDVGEWEGLDWGTVRARHPDAYRRYIEANAAAFREYGGRFLVRAGRYEAMEGSSRSRNVVIEFPSYDAALACYRSPVYQAALKLRLPVSTADLLVVEGSPLEDITVLSNPKKNMLMVMKEGVIYHRQCV